MGFELLEPSRWKGEICTASMESMDSEWWRRWEFCGTDCGWRNNWVHLGRDDGTGLFYFLGLINIHTKLVLIQTDVQELWSPSTAFLSTMRQKGYALFAPGHLDAPMHCLPSTQLALPCSCMLAFKSFHSRVCLTNLSLRHNNG